jgi:hypothetical protein
MIGIHFSSCDMSIMSPIYTILCINKIKNLKFWWFLPSWKKDGYYGNSYFHIFANLPYLFFCGELKESFLYFFIIINNEVDEICRIFELKREKMSKLAKMCRLYHLQKMIQSAGKKSQRLFKMTLSFLR